MKTPVYDQCNCSQALHWEQKYHELEAWLKRAGIWLDNAAKESQELKARIKELEER